MRKDASSARALIMSWLVSSLVLLLLLLVVVLLCSISLSRRYTDGKGKSLDRWDSSVCQARMEMACWLAG